MEKYLASERKFTVYSLIFVAGIYGAYAINIRGGVFCNAQTANMAFLGIGLATLNANQILKYIMLLSSFVFGCCISDIFSNKLFRKNVLLWEKLLIGLEIITVFVLGLLGAKISDFASQNIICFLCSMQFYTFRNCEGTAMATIFSTNNLRMFITYGMKYIRVKNIEDLKLMTKFGLMLLFFIFGAIISTIMTCFFYYKGIWIAILPLFLVFIYFMKK